MGKKHKKHHRSDREVQDETEEKPSIRMVLKIGGTPDVGASPASDGGSERKHKHKKKKKKKSGEKDKDRHHHKHDRKRKREQTEDPKVKQEVPEVEAVGEAVDEEQEAVAEPPAGEVSEIEDEVTAPPPAKRPLLMDDSLMPQHGLRKKNTEQRSELQLCLDYLQKILQRKDANGFFAFPVTDQIAPSYSAIIKQPMDFSTIKAKIDNNEYNTVSEYVRDVKLISDNCMTYNHPETIFYKEARKLWSIASKTTSKDRLLQMKHNLPFMSGITLEELGVDKEDHGSAESRDEDGSMTPTQKILERSRKTNNLFEVLSSDDMTPEEILEQAKAAAKHAADMLTLRKPKSKFGFLRRRTDGSTSMTILNPDNDGIVSEKERIVSLGNFCGKLQSGSGQLAGFREDKRNKATPVNYLNYGPFSSYAPIYDSTTSNLSKEDSDLLLTTYSDETGVQYAKSIQHFVANAGDPAVRMVDNLLDILTQGEHSKSAKILKEREREREEEEQRKQEEDKQREEQQLKEQQGAENGGPADQQPEQQPEQQPDFDALRGLSSLGIDMSFLDSFEKPPAADTEVGDPNSPIQKKLTETSELLQDLEKTQYERLSQRLPSHLSQLSGPSEKESELADKVTQELTELTKQATPADVSSVQAVRSAMGVSMTPDLSEEVSQGLASHPDSDTDNDQALEAELDELFKQQPVLFEEDVEPVMPEEAGDVSAQTMDTS